MTYPYRGYQTANKQVYKRVMNRARNTNYSSVDNLISKVNSEVGFLKNYNCRKLAINYANVILKRTENVIKFNTERLIFQKDNESEH